MISRGPWSNEGAAIDLENAQDRPVTGAPLLEMWHFVLFIHLERKKSGKYFKCWLQCQKMFFTNLESSYIRDVSKIGVIPYTILFRTGICRSEGSKWKEIEENGWKVNSSNGGIYFSALWFSPQPGLDISKFYKAASGMKLHDSDFKSHSWGASRIHPGRQQDSKAGYKNLLGRAINIYLCRFS